MQIPFPIIFNRYGFRVDTFSNVMRDFVFFFFFFHRYHYYHLVEYSLS